MSVARWIVVATAIAAATLVAQTPTPRLQLYVLPAAFSAESKKNYGTWIERLTADGLGNAIWQEIEEQFYEHPRYAVLQSPITHDEFQKILAARQATKAGAAAEPGAELAYALPDKVVTVNTNFFVRADAKLAWGKAQQREEFHVTVYLRYYDLLGGKLNIAVPAQADAVGASPIAASREATRAAVAKLLTRIERAAANEAAR